jgi:phosphatidylglycerol---prolipoprotein diacylglyceryl transferase
VLSAIPYKTFPQLGPFHTFGLLVGLGVLLGVYMMAVHMERTAGLSRDLTYSFGFWVVLVGFVGARLTYDITNYHNLSSPLDAIAVWKGGLQFAGGFLGGIAYTVFWLRQHRDIDRWHLLDGIGIALTAGLAVGRIGCYSVGEHLGGQTSFFLGLKYMGGVTREGTAGSCIPARFPNNGPGLSCGQVIHNTSLYELLHLAVLLGLLLLLRRRGHVKKGALFVIFLAWYGVARFLTDFLRAYDRKKLGLTGAQWMCLGMLVGAAVVGWRLWKRPAEAPEEETEAKEAGDTTPTGDTTIEEEAEKPPALVAASETGVRRSASGTKVPEGEPGFQVQPSSEDAGATVPEGEPGVSSDADGAGWPVRPGSVVLGADWDEGDSPPAAP